MLCIEPYQFLLNEDSLQLEFPARRDDVIGAITPVDRYDKASRGDPAEIQHLS